MGNSRSQFQNPRHRQEFAVTAQTSSERASASPRHGAAKIQSNHEKIKLREATYDDYVQIAALQSKYGLQTKSYEEWKELWLENPACKQLQNQLPIGWVLENESRRILGYLGNIPLIYELRGKKLLASVAHAWVVEADYRSYSLLLLQPYFSQKSVDLFLNATVGRLAAEAFAVSESVRVPVGIWDEGVFCIPDCQGFAASWLETKKVPLAKALSYALALPLSVKERIGASQVKRNGHIRLQQCTAFDYRFDNFWNILRQHKADKLIGLRNRESLQWHYGYALQQNRAWVVTLEKGSEISAYGIFLRRDNDNFCLRRMRLVDFQSLDGEEDILPSMFSWASQRCRKERIHMLECIGLTPEKRKLISHIAVHRRAIPCWLYYYKANRPDLAKTLSDPNVWDPTQFDGDASL